MASRVFRRDGFVIIVSASGTLYVNIQPFIKGLCGPNIFGNIRTILENLDSKGDFSYAEIDPSIYEQLNGLEPNFLFLRSVNAFHCLDVALTKPLIYPKAAEFKPRFTQMLAEIRLETIN
jgi:hypothetical protein